MRSHRGGYDELDSSVSSFLLDDVVPSPTRELEPEMVPYQPAPARVVLALLEQAHVTNDDVFVDIGSGLGQVTMLANLVAGATAVGIEIESAYCEHARKRARALGLHRVTFWNGDAREADYTAGTVFFLYTPFRGAMLDAVLERLRAHTDGRDVRLLTYGPCTGVVASQPWLAPMPADVSGVESAGIFSSRAPRRSTGC